MRRIATTLCLLLLAAAPLAAQPVDDWAYTGSIVFPEDQREFAVPYLSAVADNGTLYVISSRATDTTAHNALWKAAPGAETFELVEDFTAMGDVNVTRLRGVTTIGNDVLVSANFNPNPSTALASIYYYPNGSTERRRVFSTNAGNPGYGTFIFGLDATAEGYVYATLSYQTSIRVYDFTDPSAAGFGNWIAMDPPNNTVTGGHDSNGISALRDIALVPGADYTTTDPVFFTTRNATPSNPDPAWVIYEGSVAVWSGATARTWGSYQSELVSSIGGETQLSSFNPTGITADSQGRLWLAGPDSTRRWVKVFELFDDFAQEVFELPSATREFNPDPFGAPFQGPNDVALSPGGEYAYVIDMFAPAAFVFTNRSVVASEEALLPEGMALRPNYPNPFNPATSLAFEIGSAGRVRLAVYDMLGREVAVLVDDVRASGPHTARFDATGLPSGAYVARLEAFGRTQHQVLVLAK